jgi:signal transduction histidine kinase
VIAQTPVRLDQLVEQVVATARRQAADHHIHAQVEESVIVTGDWERLTQLLRNLLENALHHTPPDTRIDVCLCCSDSMAQIVVADSGPGIAVDNLPHIWDRFYRVDKARSRTLDGMGLGLAIVKYIAEAHGGSASVVSEPACGATFTVLLSLALEPRAAERSQTATAWVSQS